MTRLHERFLAHPDRHLSHSWSEAESLLSPEKAAAAAWMEETGGDPEVVVWKGAPIVAELSPESSLRRSVCYDREARLKRKKNAPSASAWELADAHGVLLADEELYGFSRLSVPWISGQRAGSRRPRRSGAREVRFSGARSTGGPSSTTMGRIPTMRPGDFGAFAGWDSAPGSCSAGRQLLGLHMTKNSSEDCRPELALSEKMSSALGYS